MIFFLAPDVATPIGGNKQIYRHVDLLNQAGIPAAVLHTKDGFRCNWFKHDARIAYLNGRFSGTIANAARTPLGRRLGGSLPRLSRGLSIRLADGNKRKRHEIGDEDLLVLPEFFGAALESMVDDVRFAIFNQNTHGTFLGKGFSLSEMHPIYDSALLTGVVVVSDHNLAQLEFAFPRLKVLRAINGVVPTIFNPHLAEKQRCIAFMPRKLRAHASLALHSLSHRRALRGWSIQPIENMAEAQVAEVLRRSLIFLSTCCDEGFGLPPVEAGMCGCWVVGYAGSAGQEFFDPDVSREVLQNDALSLSRALEEAVRTAERNADELVEKGRKFFEFLSQRYSLEAERQTAISAWSQLAQVRG